jgi:hypothetical protein
VRATPVNFGWPGSGTTGHLGMEMLQSVARIKLTHVPYKSAAGAIAAVIGGQIQGAMENPPNAGRSGGQVASAREGVAGREHPRHLRRNPRRENNPGYFGRLPHSSFSRASRPHPAL